MLLMRSIVAALVLLAISVRAGHTPKPANVSLTLRCEKRIVAGRNPVLCYVALVNHQDLSHLIYVPTHLYPTSLPGWPTATLVLDIRRKGTEAPLANVFLDKGSVDVPSFSARDLQVLDIGRSVGWELELRNGYYWRYELGAGEYTLQARARIGVLEAMRRSAAIRAAVERSLGKRAEDAGDLILDGQFSSETVELTIE
jgi:hypothetical protein